MQLAELLAAFLIEPNTWIIIISSLVIISYIFNLIAYKARTPSVLLLIGMGLILKLVSVQLNYDFNLPPFILEILGTTGLILIVLEATFDLHLTKEDLPVIKKAFFSSLIILVVSTLAIAFVINYWLQASFKSCFINALPLAVISSAIAIPSVAGFSKHIRDFIVYEATFSDILGIVIFNYAVKDNIIDISSVKMLGIDFLLILLLSGAGTIFLLIFIGQVRAQVKFFLIISMLSLMYATGKLVHLPSLFLVLVFGLALNNSDLFMKKNILKIVSPSLITRELKQFKLFTAEMAFFIRTLFFVFFGYSIEFYQLFDIKVIGAGIIIIMIILFFRALYLRFVVRTEIMSKLFIAPRGLITILLFYSIPNKHIIPNFSVGIVFFVVIVSSILMMIGLRISPVAGKK